MILSRRALLAAFIISGSAVPANAGCFDWLCGKTATPVLPYSVGFAPPTTITLLGPPVAVGAPFYSTPGGVAPVSGFAQPGFVTQGGFISPGVPMAAPAPYAANFGAFNTPSALQMPAYGAIPQPINNPSVLTGLPVNPNAGQSPMSAFRTTINPAFAAPYGSVATPQTSYNAAAAFQAPAQLSPGVMAQPMYAAAPQTAPGGLFGKVFGNNYQTNYNNVPTTVFRPIQQVDPTTGQTVIVQQPCLTTTQQVQRTPYSSLQPAPAAQPYYGEPTCGSEPPRYQSPTQFNPTPQYNPAPQYAPQSQYAPQANVGNPNGYSPSNNAIGSGVSQAGAQDPNYGGATGNSYNGYVSPIPSTDPAPLQGYPSTQPALPPVVNPNGYGQPSDQSQVVSPALGASNWGRSNREADDAPRSLPLSMPSTNVSSKYSDLPPIPAADDYRPPAWGGQPNSNAQPQGAESSRPVTPQPAISPPSWNDRTAQRLTEPRDGEQSGRYASQAQFRNMSAQNPVAAPPIRRNDGGWFPISQ